MRPPDQSDLIIELLFHLMWYIQVCVARAAELATPDVARVENHHQNDT